MTERVDREAPLSELAGENAAIWMRMTAGNASKEPASERGCGTAVDVVVPIPSSPLLLVALVSRRSFLLLSGRRIFSGAAELEADESMSALI